MHCTALKISVVTALVALGMSTARAEPGTLIGYTAQGVAIRDCLTVVNEVDFPSDDSPAFPVILRGRGEHPLYVTGLASLDPVRRIVTIKQPEVARSSDGSPFSGQLLKLAYHAIGRPDHYRLAPSNECGRQATQVAREFVQP
ncbi:hypothetical protein A9R05_42410 (plasmid) [Burkholderia sp. KK1]|uniref:Lipoprotein n=1 Tax=Burkholderia sp. M701 TaxID=326454 RepID=V5YPR1_9BURK|nr:hypothetical protein [Burkholderia sp. M701]AQH05674.1 hypothetical protein A9R05_42410 [Burkholderia sp. KK1]BAO18921.1 hypothetical protein [Burkholderia sp. M701]